MSSTSILKRPYFFEKTMKGYETLHHNSERSSSDDTLPSYSGLLEKSDNKPYERKSCWSKYAFFVVFNTIVFVIYGASLVLIMRDARERALSGPQLIPGECDDDCNKALADVNVAPAQSVIRWERKTFQHNSEAHGPFSGYPREEIDQNWRDLLNG